MAVKSGKFIITNKPNVVEQSDTDIDLDIPESASSASDWIAGIELDAIISGALMRVHFIHGTNPAEIPTMLRDLDPNVVFKDSFPSRSGGAARETKLARAIVVSLESRGDMIFIRITAHADDDDLAITVPKKKVPDFVPAVDALGKLTDKNIEKLKNAFGSKRSVTIILGESEAFGVKFWVADDKTAYLDSVQAEPPA